jgi:hypothetical protein
VRGRGWLCAVAVASATYRATLVATDAAGNHSLPRVVKFRVVKR